MGWYERTGRWFEMHRFGVDLTTAVLLALFMLVSATDLYATSPYLSRTGSIAWTVALLAPLPWRRTRPVPSAVAIFAVALAHMVVGFPMIMPGDLLVLVALFSVTTYGPTWAHITAISATAVGSVVALPIAVAARSGLGASGIIETIPVGLFCLVTGLAVWAFALVRRSRRVAMDALRDRAHRLEIERDQQARIGAAAERARIAREMHDIVAHSLSIVVAQADGGRYAAAADPPAAVQALATISETGRSALTDMRRLLGVLRSHDDDAPPAGEDAPVTPAVADTTAARAPASGEGPTARPAPQPGVGELEDLVGQARAGGLRVAFARIGDERPLPAGMGLTLYRVCQESLSNVRKHAGPDPAVSVAVAWARDTVRLEVTDDGRGAAASAHADPGFGLRGMHERANLYGGTLEAGPRRGGGFRVLLELPLPGAGAATTTGPPTSTTTATPAPPEENA
ncbi:sensor histidine kinase [Isoptericola cucumis]|uniref:histidine kinase n=1 Tax=Isoptericola cucumis TaxID=1776856 RepID=A0ABQ2BA06_9MICO|nr:sensor histidine kinase [Isoptericola cucumis]GGI09789.1 two-component sensor histidine kinase [Isoptericola cucumis]